jgi:hypothetical protein
MPRPADIKAMTEAYDHYRSLYLRGTPQQIREATQKLEASIKKVKKSENSC